MRSFDRGFTVLEMLVAAGIAVLIMTLALVALTTTTRAQNRSRKLLIEQEEARSALSRMRRDIEGIFEANGNYFEIQGDVLVMICATENRGGTDYANVTYRVKDADSDGNAEELVRDEAGGAGEQVIARNVRRARFESNGASPPAWVKVTLSMKGEDLSTSELGSAPAGELYEIRWYEETVNVPAGF